MARKKLYGAAAAAHAKKMGRRSGGKRRKSTALVRTKTRTRTVVVRRRGRKGSSPMKLTHLALATAALGFITKPGATSGIQGTINNAMAKVPGTATFGSTAMLGIGALAIDRFVKPNKWLKLLGTAGIVLAAAQVGQKGTDFKFLGDESGDFDLADDDVGDSDDDVGDYDE